MFETRWLVSVPPGGLVLFFFCAIALGYVTVAKAESVLTVNW